MRSKTKPGSHSRFSADAVKQKNMQQENFALESERDSGYSDAGSEYLSITDQADATEQDRGSRPHIPQKAPAGAAYPSLSSMILMNNVLLKPPSEDSIPVKSSSFCPGVEMFQHPQMVVLQPLASKDGGGGSSIAQRGKVSKQRLHNKYLPILKSYPRIAPHPGRSLPSFSEFNGLVPGHRPPHQRAMHQPCRARVSATNLPSPPSVSPSCCSPQTSCAGSLSANAQVEQPVDGMEPAVPVPASGAPAAGRTEPGALSARPYSASREADCPGSPSECRTKRKRFRNTYNILSMSGLLDITLRTKELIRQNRRTQGDLEQLRRHASLLVEAAGSSDPQVWARLQLIILETSAGGFLEKEEVLCNSVG
ncbi:CLOCK-interacting pacemaker-like [Scleropages formosus]|uniref:CLOCK-interacting pacemaker b n=1 Tax=Scleropages formosus TaxID=113540 RepID=A0A8C9TAM9_SCLFO|nr:CLOCK-interacting pacemaker-like [Scleropages formosus]